jgi:hypothetical protein
LQRAVREEVILRRTAQKEVIEQQIRHRLQPLAQYLPDNPRHVKRIINAISMYQNSILLTEDYGEAEFGGELWRRLVVGVVLMVGYPKSWSILAKNPSLADEIIQENAAETARIGLEPIGYNDLIANKNFTGLLFGSKLLDQSGNEAAETLIDAEAVRWLNRIVPVSG